MNEPYKKFSAESLKDFEAALSDRSVSELIEKTKADVSAGTIRFVISTDDEDRQGDALDQSKWDISKFLLNPVVLWAHQYDEPPIGMMTNVVTEGNKTYGDIRFTPENVYEFGAQIGKLAQGGWINTVSVGYIEREDGTRELLEVSCCPVPANAFALAQRDVRKMGLNIEQLVTKGLTFSITKEEEKGEQIGGRCELDDGTPGVLAEDDDNPGALICVPPEGGKGLKEKPNEMELIKTLKAEHGRHGKTIAKHIDEFTEKAMPDDGDEKANKPDEEFQKAIAEFGEKMDAEHGVHLEKCMKAVDDHAYEIDPEAKKGMKGIDEFKSAMESEHAKHTKALKKAISVFKKDWADGDGNKEKCDKAVSEFTKAHGDELDRHEKAHMDLCEAEMPESEEKTVTAAEEKGAVAEEMAEDDERQAKYKRLDRAYSVFYAFTSAYMDEATPEDDFEKLLDEAVSLMKEVGAEAKSEIAKAIMKHYVEKSGRAISAKTKEKLETLAKAIEDHHADHGEDTKTITDALKAIIGDEGASGEEQKPQKQAPAPKQRSGSSGASASSESFEAYMISRQLLKTVASATENGLRKIKEIMREQFPDRR